ncbi:MAG: ATP-binding protein [Bacteroidales bacterium]|nr:ATP-binding protein [Bacteroidales bacterium]
MFHFDDMPVIYPVGEHSFRELRQKGCVYVDKTIYVARMITQAKFIFLSRPRRFGKSLMLSTVEYYFRGAKELFEGTWIGEHEKEWKQYPVLRFDMTETEATTAAQLARFLHKRVGYYEKLYGVADNSSWDDIGLRYNTLIKNVYEVTGRQAVILVDEYDKGLLESLDAAQEEQEAMTTLLRAFYSQPKAATEAIKFCLVTGVARFGHLTLFSGPNNYLDISMNPMYAAICGITQQEVIDYFQEGINALAQNRGVSHDDMIEALRVKYDSYRFTQGPELVYNPFSLLCAFSELSLDNFWIKSGTSKVFVKYLTRSEFDLMELEKLWVTRDRMESKYSKEDSIPLLFQTGYLTIKDVMEFKLYRLGIPNGEVRSALVDQLMPKYMGISEDVFSLLMTQLLANLKKGNVEAWVEDIKSLISRIPNQLFGPIESHLADEEKRAKAKEENIARFERTYHIIIHMICQMIKVEAQSEVAFSGGRADMVIETKKFVYVIEYKLDSPASEALRQIDEKGYLLPWHADDRKVYKIGISFSSNDRNITEMKYE